MTGMDVSGIFIPPIPGQRICGAYQAAVLGAGKDIDGFVQCVWCGWSLTAHAVAAERRDKS